jgi:hypothetical protein
MPKRKKGKGKNDGEMRGSDYADSFSKVTRDRHIAQHAGDYAMPILGRLKGGSWLSDQFDSVDRGLKQSHLLSNIGSVALPALGGFIGSFADPFVGPLGTAVGGMAGVSANDFIKNQGYGRKKKQQAKGYLATPLNVSNGGSRFPQEYVGRVQGGGRKMRGKGIGFTAVFGTISSDHGTPNLK